MFRALAGTTREADDRPCSVLFDTESYRIGIDTFVSGCLSPDKEIFITYKASEGKNCKGIAAGLKIKGRGKF